MTKPPLTSYFILCINLAPGGKARDTSSLLMGVGQTEIGNRRSPVGFVLAVGEQWVQAGVGAGQGGDQLADLVPGHFILEW